jgi:putative endonuclease
VTSAKIASYNFGLLAELFTIIYLFFTFHRILAWRYKTKLGEVDIIAKKGNNIIFFEVKARKDKNDKEVLTSNQQRRISDAAKLFIQKNKSYYNFSYRFDLIIFNSPLAFNHIKNSWSGF